MEIDDGACRITFSGGVEGDMDFLLKMLYLTLFSPNIYTQFFARKTRHHIEFHIVNKDQSNTTVIYNI